MCVCVCGLTVAISFCHVDASDDEDTEDGGGGGGGGDKLVDGMAPTPNEGSWQGRMDYEKLSPLGNIPSSRV